MITEPAEHTRYHDYIRALSQISDADERSLLVEILGDSDRTMADAEILGHLDRRAAALSDGEAFTNWAQQTAEVLHGRELPERRLREWSLFKNIDSGRSWSVADLAEASDWLQRRTAEHTASQQVLTILAGQGRTSRIRNAARIRIDRRVT